MKAASAFADVTLLEVDGPISMRKDEPEAFAFGVIPLGDDFGLAPFVIDRPSPFRLESWNVDDDAACGNADGDIGAVPVGVLGNDIGAGLPRGGGPMGESTATAL